MNRLDERSAPPRHSPIITTRQKCALRLTIFMRHPFLGSHLIGMNDLNRIVERRLLLGALVCAVLMIVCYFVLVSTPWGHNFDDDAVFRRKTLHWQIITLDSHILGLVRKKTLLLAAAVMLVIASVRRCTFVGVVAVAAFGSAVVGAEVGIAISQADSANSPKLLGHNCGRT
jgi:hypothetical protein